MIQITYIKVIEERFWHNDKESRSYHICLYNDHWSPCGWQCDRYQVRYPASFSNILHAAHLEIRCQYLGLLILIRVSIATHAPTTYSVFSWPINFSQRRRLEKVLLSWWCLRQPHMIIWHQTGNDTQIIGLISCPEIIFPFILASKERL